MEMDTLRLREAFAKTLGFYGHDQENISRVVNALMNDLMMELARQAVPVTLVRNRK